MASRTTDRTGDRGAQAPVHVALETLGQATAEVEAKLGTAVQATGAGVRATGDVLRRRSDTTLGLLAAFATGVTSGLMLGGAHRLVTVTSLIPATLIYGVILERTDRRRRRPASD